MTLTDVNEMFSTDEQCRTLLAKLRWPYGPECVRCKSKNLFGIPSQKKYECAECGYQFTVTAGTIFHDSHLPLEKWFLAALLICESRKGMSANQVKRLLGISYKTAWYLCHRIRAAMVETERPMLDGIVEMDETYVGGKGRGKGITKRGRGTDKEVVIGIRQRGGALRFFHAQDVKSGTLAKYISENISQDVDVIMTDEFNVYRSAMRKANVTAPHEQVNHSAKEYVRLGTDIHTNTAESAFSLLKRGIIGTWHKISAKHLQAYLHEMEFRFDRRNRSDLFIDALRHMVTADPLTFERLTAV
ncbi:MAG TPA: IS1595 family transposase [Candidatus Limnocylindrales bacterium]|nr:IS1595 family transposase [Candidatus Limnocylindrales bacterium]